MKDWINSQKSTYDKNYIDEDNYDNEFDLSKLNKDQLFAYKVIDYNYKNNNQLLMIISGDAGTGKSFAINSISYLLKEKLKKAAPTGKAALLINGETIHSLFNLPVTNNKNKYNKLEGNKLKELQMNFSNIDFIIIDENSIVSQDILAKIHLRLQEAKLNNNLFGNVSIILIGDINQIVPFQGSPLYNTDISNNMDNLGYKIYQEFKDVIKFTELVRQLKSNDEDQNTFLNILPRLRDGECTIQDWQFLNKRNLNDINTEEFNNSIYLSDLNETIDKYNFNKLKETQTPILKINSKHDKNNGIVGTADQFGGLKQKLYININSRIILISNIW
jgi:hypothetical protein